MDRIKTVAFRTLDGLIAVDVIQLICEKLPYSYCRYITPISPPKSELLNVHISVKRHVRKYELTSKYIFDHDEELPLYQEI